MTRAAPSSRGSARTQVEPKTSGPGRKAQRWPGRKRSSGSVLDMGAPGRMGGPRAASGSGFWLRPQGPDLRFQALETLLRLPAGLLRLSADLFRLFGAGRQDPALLVAPAQPGLFHPLV